MSAEKLLLSWGWVPQTHFTLYTNPHYVELKAAFDADERARQQQAKTLQERDTELQVVRKELEGKESALQATVLELRSLREVTAQELEQKEAALREVESLRRDAGQAAEELQAARATITRDAAKLEAQARDLDRQRAELEAKAQALAQTEAALCEARAEATDLRRRVGDLEGDVADVSNKLHSGILDVRKYWGESPLDFYDAILTIDNLEDIYVPDKGWQVRVSQKRTFDFSSPMEGVRVIPLGHFNTGKTWLIHQLSGAELPKGAAVHTEGISIKEATADELKIILLDTVGANSPMDSLPNGVDARQASNGAETVLQEMRAQEDFYRQVCFEVGQVIILVVGQMSHKDQTDLVRLGRQIRKDRVRKDIVVAHNLRDWDMAMLLQKSDKDGMNYVERTKTLFGLSDNSLAVTIGTETKKVIRHNGLFEAEDNSREAVVKVFHYYLTDHRLPCSCNRFVIQDMKMIITRSGGSRKSLAEEIATAATKIQSRFASFNVDEPEVVFDAEASRFHIKEQIPDGAYRMKPRDLGSYFTMSSDDPPYSITLVPCSVKKTRGYKVKTEVVQARKAYHLQIELPGLCAKSLQDIKEQFVKEDDTAALRWEAAEGERAEQCTICFQADLLNIPDETYNDVAEKTGSKIELGRELAAHESKDVGSRHHFRGGVRTVKVMLRTGIMDYDTSEEPIVTYVDGVLGIMLVQQPRRG